MFFVFAAFVPEGASMIKVIALGLAVGVAVDAFLVRMTLVPAVMALAGRAAWWLPKPLARLLPNVDIEGEGLTSAREDAEWAAARLAAGEAITLDALAVGDAPGVRLAVPAGAIALAGGDPAERRLLAATVAGRVAPAGGRAQVAGHPVPAESGRVARLVALADLGGGRAETRVTVRELLDERIRLTGAWYRAFRVRGRVDRWIERIAAVLARVVPDQDRVSAASVVGSLPQLQRAVVLAAAALAEQAPVVLLDIVDPLPEADARALIVALEALAPGATTVVLGVSIRGASGVATRSPDRVISVLEGTAS
jgi:RND superfamily putative drug exporter